MKFDYFRCFLKKYFKRAFSLIEILVCISILLVLASTTIPRFFDVDKALLMHELDKLFVTFSYVQQKAIASNTQQMIRFELVTNSYFYLNQAHKQVPQALANSIKFGFLKTAKGPPSTPVNFIKKPITFENQKTPLQVIFYPDGKITPGSLYLVDKKEKNMVALTCSISQVSYVRKYVYNKSTWVCI